MPYTDLLHVSAQIQQLSSEFLSRSRIRAVLSQNDVFPKGVCLREKRFRVLLVYIDVNRFTFVKTNLSKIPPNLRSVRRLGSDNDKFITLRFNYMVSIFISPGNRQ